MVHRGYIYIIIYIYTVYNIYIYVKANEFKMQAWLNANEGIDEIPTDDEDDFSQDENDSANESMDDEHDQAAVELDELVVENVEVVVDAADVAGPVEPDFENFDDEKFDD